MIETKHSGASATRDLLPLRVWRPTTASIVRFDLAGDTPAAAGKEGRVPRVQENYRRGTRLACSAKRVGKAKSVFWREG
ncbi:MAG: hypothetical protein V1784_03395 [bacterium]